MNKKAKIAMAAVSVVMAGTMAVGVVGCSGDDKAGKYDVTIGIAAGNSKDITTSTSFRDLDGQITLPDGNTYQVGDLKPAWQALSDRLEVNIEDKWTGFDAGNHLTNAIAGTEGYVEDKSWDNIDIITSNLSKINAETKPKLLNLYDYLDMMPNYKAFLEANPVVKYSVMSNMKAGEEELYVTPYFDGNDDVERYCIIRQDWASKILDGDTAFSKDGVALAADYAKAEAEYTGSDNYMYVTNKTDAKKVDSVAKSYSNVLAEIKTPSSALDTAYKAASGDVAYAGTSGNIVDIMNAAIATGHATGKTLVNLFRAYVDACYLLCEDYVIGPNTDGGPVLKTDSNGKYISYYDKAHRSELFNGANAAWDVDDLVAMLRCVVNNSENICPGATAEGIFPRDNSFDRTPDLMMLASQLYGVRGAASRLEYTYIDALGYLKDMRNDIQTYEAAAKMNKLKQEGLIVNYNSPENGNVEYRYKKGETPKEGFMMFDYVQTQTQYMFYAEDSSLTFKDGTLDDGYYFAPIVNPLATWEFTEGSDGGAYLRFSESWRSVKTNGWAVNKNVESDPAKLNKVLQLMDFMYSQEGQILMTYGPMADAEGKGGFWHNEKATADQIKNGQYFVYRGVKYAGTEYGSRYTPTLTKNVMDSFKGKKVNDWAVGDDSKVSNAQINFTNYARKLVGSCLPVGIVKDQGFENQLTAEAGKKGSNNVGYGIDNGTILHPYLNIDPTRVEKLYNTSFGYWLTEVPTALPYSTEQSAAVNAATQDKVRGLTTKVGSNKKIYSIFTEIIFNGMTDRSVTTADAKAGTYTMPTDAAGCLALVQNEGNLAKRTAAMDGAWKTILDTLGLERPEL